MGSPAESLLTAIALVAALWGVGRPVARWLVPDADPLTGLVWSVALGMLAWQSLLGLAVAGGWWELAPLSTLTLLGATWGMIEYVAWLAPRFVWPRQTGARAAVSPNRLVALLAELFARPPLFGPAVLALVATLLICLTPPTRALAPSDSLAEAHRLAASGSAQTLAQGLMTPGVGATLLYAWAESIADPEAVCLLNFAAGLFFAAAIAIVARPVLGSRHALTAGAIALITPGVLDRLAFPSNDLLPAALLLLAAAACWQASVEFGGRRYHAIAALMVAGALGPAWIFATALAIAWRWAQAPVRREVLPQPSITRALIESGALRGTGGVAALVVAGFAALASGGAWRLAVECFGSAVGCGPFLIAAAPGLWWARRLRGMRRLGIGLGALVAATCLVSIGAAALLLAALLAIVAAWVWVELERFRPAQRSLARVGLVGLAMSGLWATFSGAGLRWPPDFSVAGRERWLDEQLGCYRATQVANGIIRSDDHLLTNDPQSYWIRCLVTDARLAPATLTEPVGEQSPEHVEPRSASGTIAGERAVQQAGERVAAIGDAGAADPLSVRLRRLGVTHLLLVDPAGGASSAHDPLSRLADRELASADGGDLLPLLEYVKDVKRQPQRYRLIAVRRESRLAARGAKERSRGVEHVAARNVIPDTRQQPPRQH